MAWSRQDRQTLQIQMQRSDSINTKMRIMRKTLRCLVHENGYIRQAFEQAAHEGLSEEETLLLTVINLAVVIEEQADRFTDYVNTQTKLPVMNKIKGD